MISMACLLPPIPSSLREVLRDEWKFDGFVVSDYTSIEELMKHGTGCQRSGSCARSRLARA